MKQPGSLCPGRQITPQRPRGRSGFGGFALLAFLALSSCEVGQPAPLHHRLLRTPGVDFLRCLAAVDAFGWEHFMTGSYDSKLLLRAVDSMAAILKHSDGGDSVRAEALAALLDSPTSPRPLLQSFQPDDYLPTAVLQNRAGSCTGLSSLIMAAGLSADWPVAGVLLPGHFFVRYQGDAYVRNIESLRRGLNRSDEFYVRRFSLGPARSYDLSSLLPTNSLAVLVFNLGNAFLARKDWRRAEDEYRLALDLISRFPEAHGNLGLALMAQDKLREALPHLETALRLDSLREGGRQSLAECNRRMKRYSQASRLYRQLADEYPENTLFDTRAPN